MATQEINSSFLRTAAVIYADEGNVINTKTVCKKIIEVTIAGNNNDRIGIHQIIDKIKIQFMLDFSEDEIKNIVCDEKYQFEYTYIEKKQDHYVKLSDDRYQALQKKINSNIMEDKILEFHTHIYQGAISYDEFERGVFNFLYQVLNKSISSFKKITNSKCKIEDVSIDANQFTPEMRIAINAFLAWEDIEKNIQIFALISSSLEYSLISNNIKSSNIFIDALKNKVFYLDNNIIYRAIGINGINRKRRIRSFLAKCIKSGQKLKISIYTKQEFRDSIDYHIKQLHKVSFSRINPELFRITSRDSGIYEYYHKWRRDRTIYGFDIFRSTIEKHYQEFLKEFNIEEDYEFGFKENSEVSKKISAYIEEIRRFKPHAPENILKYDATNIFFIEKKRDKNNINLKDTKFYFVSTDQKLRNWDFNRNDYQPIALLPSQWYAILLKYFSRSEDDFKSYMSFLRVRTGESIIKEEQLQTVLSGISEITSDFSEQEEILNSMLEIKFRGILTSNDVSEVHRLAATFATEEYEKKMKKLKTDQIDEIYRLKSTAKNEKNKLEEDFNNKILTEMKKSFQSLKNQKDILDKKSSSAFFRLKLYLIGSMSLYLAALIFLILIFGWNKVEWIVYILGFIGILFTYGYVIIKGKTFNPVDLLSSKKEKIIEKNYVKNNFDLSRYNYLKNQIKIREATLSN